MDAALNTSILAVTDEMLKLVAEIDEFRGAWKAIGHITRTTVNKAVAQAKQKQQQGQQQTYQQQQKQRRIWHAAPI